MAAPEQDAQDRTLEKSVQDRLVEAAEELFCRRGYVEHVVRFSAAGIRSCANPGDEGM